MRLPKKEYLTFEEITEEWKCSDRDLYHQIITRKLVPSAFFTGKFLPRTFSDRSPINDGEYIEGFYYLTNPDKFSLNGFISFFFSKSREPKDGDIIYFAKDHREKDYEMVFHFNANDQTVDIPGNVVFMREEIDRFEREYVQNPPEKNDNQKSNDSLDGKAKTTALKLIGGLVMDGYGMNIHANRLTGVSDIVSALAGKGIGLTEETVSNWIKEAAQVIEKPKAE